MGARVAGASVSRRGEAVSLAEASAGAAGGDLTTTTRTLMAAACDPRRHGNAACTSRPQRLLAQCRPPGLSVGPTSRRPSGTNQIKFWGIQPSWLHADGQVGRHQESGRQAFPTRVADHTARRRILLEQNDEWAVSRRYHDAGINRSAERWCPHHAAHRGSLNVPALPAGEPRLERNALTTTAAGTRSTSPWQIGASGASRPSYAFVEQPQTNGVAERFNRTLKEQIVHGRIYRNIAELRDAVRGFVKQYNAQWIVEKNRYLSPAQARLAWHATTSLRPAA